MVARNEDGGYLSALEEEDSPIVGMGGCWLENSELFIVVDAHGKWRTLYVARRLRDMSEKRAAFKGLPRLSAR